MTPLKTSLLIPHKTKLLPKREVAPLTLAQGFELSKRIRAIHSRAFAWDASQYVTDTQLNEVCQKWQRTYGGSRDERELVKSVITKLDLAEQHR